ncbi:MAG TPA: toll/interleukin-1 receptor domain-containing protein [Sphingomicrobium sp.]|nr:toll/interleukin-1 receptor domain-containing protein [Sphingomicrobium sp.]
MPRVAQLQRPVRVHESAPDVAHTTSRHHLYYAFLSYSHADEAMARWLHEKLENFRIPAAIAGRLTEHGVVPARLKPIFRDRGELAAAGDLGTEIREALAASRFLIVLCSPAAARSRWTNAEIDAFKRSRPDGCVLAAIVAGEPFASDMPGRENEECLPPALRTHYDRRGRPTKQIAEPLAADLREAGDGRRIGFLKLVAGMTGVGLDDLVQRESIRRQRRLALLAAASIAGMAVTSALAVTAIDARDAARDQRREAEGLVGFMLGDLRAKLEPIGRLDALDGVGSRVYAYYKQQDTSELSDAALLQRSRALSLMAEVANLRGDLDGASRLYREATAGTAEAIRRDPRDTARLFDHAQNVFWVGEIALQRGDPKSAEAAFRSYRELASRMIGIEPDNMKWRMEAQYADTNLGVVLFAQRRFDEAGSLFQSAHNTMEAVATADPGNDGYQKAIPESLAWLADARFAQGRLREALASRQKQVELLERGASPGSDVDYRQKLIPAERALGILHAALGNPTLGIAHLRRAVDHAHALIPRDASNSRWQDFTARAELNLAELLLASGTFAEARSVTQAACNRVDRFLAADPSAHQWRSNRRECLILNARIALGSRDPVRALNLAQTAVGTARAVKSTDPSADGFALAKALRVLGDAQARSGNRAAASAAWRSALAALPGGTAKPAELGEQHLILLRAGQASAAQGLARRLAAMGYRYPAYLSDRNIT